MGLDVKVTKDKIAAGKTALGIEFGSTRIKACLLYTSRVPYDRIDMDTGQPCKYASVCERQMEK